MLIETGIRIEKRSSRGTVIGNVDCSRHNKPKEKLWLLFILTQTTSKTFIFSVGYPPMALNKSESSVVKWRIIIALVICYRMYVCGIDLILLYTQNSNIDTCYTSNLCQNKKHLCCKGAKSARNTRDENQ